MRAEKSTVHVYGFGFRSSLSMRGSRLGYEVTSQTQAVQSTAVMSLVFRSSLPTEGDGVSPTRPPSVVVGGETRKERKAHYTSAVVPWYEVSEENEGLPCHRHERVEILHDAVQRPPDAPAANGREEDAERGDSGARATPKRVAGALDAAVRVALRLLQRALYLAADGAPRRVARRLDVTTPGVQAVLRALCCMGADDVAPVLASAVRGKAL